MKKISFTLYVVVFLSFRVISAEKPEAPFNKHPALEKYSIIRNELIPYWILLRGYGKSVSKEFERFKDLWKL